MTETVGRYPSDVVAIIHLLTERIAAARQTGYMGQEERASALALIAEHRMRAGTSGHTYTPGAIVINTLVGVIDDMTFRPED